MTLLQRKVPLRVLFASVAGVVLLFGIGMSLTTITLDVIPADARVSVPGTTLSYQWHGRLYVFPGMHVVRAERAGYRPAQMFVVAHASPAVIHLRLLQQAASVE